MTLLFCHLQCDHPRETWLLHNQICRAQAWEVVSWKGKKGICTPVFYNNVWYIKNKNIDLVKYPKCLFLQFSNGWSFGDQICEISKSHNLLKPYKGLSEKVVYLQLWFCFYVVIDLINECCLLCSCTISKSKLFLANLWMHNLVCSMSTESFTKSGYLISVENKIVTLKPLLAQRVEPRLQWSSGHIFLLRHNV